MPELVRCSGADRDGLKDLRASGWTIGIATNGMVDNQVGKIRRTGLSDLVDGWVISSEAGFRKPDAAIFETLARRLSCDLIPGWMVGDSLEADVAGGNNVGLHTAWVTSNVDTLSPGDPQPTITVPRAADAIRNILS